jgi:type IV pilus assembly protein PilA
MLNKLLKKYAKNEKGLTLIELLVVIVILGIIAAIAVVSIGNIIGETKEKATVTEAVQIINAAKLAHSTNSSVTTWASTTESANALSEYVSNLKDYSWSVTWTKAGGYTITGHDALAAVVKKTSTATDPLSEKTLTKYLDQ